MLYLTESVPKSAKLMRWAMALQEFSVTFKYRAGRANVAADCLSRLKSNYTVFQKKFTPRTFIIIV